MHNNLSVNKLGFLPGDVIKAFRGMYFHFGVYVGDGRVVHFCSTGSNELDPQTADIQETSYERFSKGNKVTADKMEQATYEPDEIVQRARSMIGTKLGTYNLLSNNCEHFANWCRCGKLVSHQRTLVDTVSDMVLKQESPIRKMKDMAFKIFGKKEEEVEKLLGIVVSFLIVFYIRLLLASDR